MTVYGLSCHRLKNPLAISGEPRFSWKLQSSVPGCNQVAYRLCVWTKNGSSENPDIFDSGKRTDSNTLDVVTGISEWSPFEKYFWRVKVWSEKEESAFSETAFFETGPLCSKDWKAKWIHFEPVGKQAEVNKIANPFDLPRISVPVRYYRKAFSVKSTEILRARLYFSSRAAGYIRINGKSANNIKTDPLDRPVGKCVVFTTYDITDYLISGNNVCAVESVGTGLSLLIVITYANGEQQFIGTDGSWKTHEGTTKILPGDTGEAFDARMSIHGWSLSSFNDGEWAPAVTVSAPSSIIKAKELPPLQIKKIWKPEWCKKTGADCWVFGINRIIVGSYRIKMSAPAGTQIAITMSEQLNSDGTLKYVKNSFVPDISVSVATSYYTFAGEGAEIWSPTFAYSSFQYVEIKGYLGELSVDNLQFEEIGTPIKQIASFRSSNELFNTLFENMCNTIENNCHDGFGSTFMDEKSVTIDGDASFACEAILFSYDAAGVYLQGTQDLLGRQNEDGSFRMRMPIPEGAAEMPPMPSPEWESATVHVTKFLDDYCGTRYNTIACYEDNKRFMQSEISEMEQLGDLQDSAGTGGDWNSPESEPSPEGGIISGSTWNHLTLALLAEMASETGHGDDIPLYEQWQARIQRALNARFLRENSYYATDRQTYVPKLGGPTGWSQCTKEIPVGYRQASNLMPLVCRIVPDSAAEAVVQGLLADIRSRDNHLDTGCIATRFLLNWLSENGFVDVAYEIANQRTFPSWGYWVENGATSMWEHWADHSRSRSHYFLGAGIQEWFFKSLTGLRNVRGGFRTFDIAPIIPKKMDAVSTTIETVRGKLAVNWKKTKPDELRLTVLVPPTATARVFAPVKSINISEEDIEHKCEGSYVTCESGIHTFCFSYRL